MTQRVNTLREINKYDYSNDIRPYILTSVNENIVSNIQQYEATGGNIISGGGSVDLSNITELTLTSLNVQEINATNINSYELTTQFINSFSVKSGNDVKFFGVDNTGFKKLFWDSSDSTLYIDGDQYIANPHLKLHINSINSNIDQSLYDSDVGILFKYYDTDYHGSKFGFFGFDGDTHRFSLKESIQSQDNRKIISDGTTQSLIIANIEVNELYVTKISQIENTNSDFSIIAQNNNNLNIVSGNDLNFYGNNVNFNISGDYSLINNNSNTSLINISSDINLTTTNGDINLDIINGNFDLLVNGTLNNEMILQNINSNIKILSGSTSNESILLDTDGGIKINISDSFEINTTNGNSLTFNSNNGLSSTIEKNNFNKWISFYKFNVHNGLYLTDREYTVNLGVTLPKHFWKKEKSNEKSIIYTDIELPSRTENQKGMKLEQIHIGYRVEDQDLNNILIRLTKKHFDENIGIYQLNVINIPYNNINLNNGITNGQDHFRGIEISNPFFINDESILNLEIEIDTPSNSLFKFYGCNLKFSKNDL